MASAADVASDCYYKVLGVAKTASEADITRAYRKLALKHHPDKNRDDPQRAEERFKRITEAYDVLRDPEKRKEYDQFGKAIIHPGGEAPDGSAAGGGGLSAEEAQRIFRTVFSGFDFFGGGGGLDGFSDSGNAGSPQGFNVFFQRSPGGFAQGFGSPGGFARNSAGRRAVHCSIAQGTEVAVGGLAKAQEHNGKIGAVMSYDTARGRYKVQFEDGASVMLRPENVTQLCRVVVAGLAGKPELNGCRGQIFAFDQARNRYQVLLDSPEQALSLQPVNCLLPLGTCVVLTGLAKADLNGTMARILGVDHSAERYTVQCHGGRRMKVKFGNVRC